MIAATLRQMAAPAATVKSEIHITSLRRRFVCASRLLHVRKSSRERKANARAGGSFLKKIAFGENIDSRILVKNYHKADQIPHMAATTAPWYFGLGARPVPEP